MNSHYQSKLICATCAGDDFEFNEDKSYIKCMNCGREYFGGYNELLEYNQDAKEEVMRQIKKDTEEMLKSELQKAFKSIKGIKINIK